MARPRKNRVGEYAGLLAEELQRQLSLEVTRALDAQAAEHDRQIAELRAEIRGLTRQVEALAKRAKAPKPKVGKWVPGGPGRPPKDASERIAAFEERTSRGTRKKKK